MSLVVIQVGKEMYLGIGGSMCGGEELGVAALGSRARGGAKARAATTSLRG